MEFKTVTLRYAPTLGIIDDAPLVALAREHELLAVREHFFVVHDVPHLLCLVSCQRKPTPVTTPAIAPLASPAPPIPSASPSPPEPLPADPTAGDPTASDPAPPDPAPPAITLTSEQRRLYEAIRRTWCSPTATSPTSCASGPTASRRCVACEGSVNEGGDANRVMQGGNFDNEARNARSAYRNRNEPGNRWSNVGFRPAQGVPLGPTIGVDHRRRW